MDDLYLEASIYTVADNECIWRATRVPVAHRLQPLLNNCRSRLRALPLSSLSVSYLVLHITLKVFHIYTYVSEVLRRHITCKDYLNLIYYRDIKDASVRSLFRITAMFLFCVI